MKPKFEQREPHWTSAFARDRPQFEAIREVSPDAFASIQARVDAQVADARKDLATKEQALTAAKAEAQLGAFPPELNALIHDMAARLDRAEAYATRLEGLCDLSAEENRQLGAFVFRRFVVTVRAHS